VYIATKKVTRQYYRKLHVVLKGLVHIMAILGNCFKIEKKKQTKKTVVHVCLGIVALFSKVPLFRFTKPVNISFKIPLAI